uniref:Uncharacterized protein n=1 Tax=Tanacetum cinerariifolium TaxID=118510 RepID=A0A699HC13_TANCI|nr:hypothetical protein [Tanacetum cinerariifolium]
MVVLVSVMTWQGWWRCGGGGCEVMVAARDGDEVAERMVVMVGWIWCGEGGDDDGVDDLGGGGWPEFGRKRWEALENEKLESNKGQQMGGARGRAYAIGDGILHAVRGGVDDGEEMAAVVVLGGSEGGDEVAERMVVVVGWRWCGKGGDDDGADDLGGGGWPEFDQNLTGKYGRRR